MKYQKPDRCRIHAPEAIMRKIEGTAEARRRTRNCLVEKLNDQYKRTGKCDYTFTQLSNRFRKLRDGELAWIKKYPSEAIRGSIIWELSDPFRKLEVNKKNHFIKLENKDSPLWFHISKKSKIEGVASRPGKLKIKGNYLYIEKIGWVRLHGNNKDIGGKPIHATIKKEGDNWYAYITYEFEEIEKPLINPRVVGIYINHEGIILSDGTRYPKPDTGKENKKLKILEHGLECKEKGSKHSIEAEKAVAKVCAKIIRILCNWTHHISRDIANNYDIAIFEKSNIKDMTEIIEKNLAQKTGLSGWEILGYILSFKLMKFNGRARHMARVAKRRRVIEVEIQHADQIGVNAAKNILAEGLELLAFCERATGRKEVPDLRTLRRFARNRAYPASKGA